MKYLAVKCLSLLLVVGLVGCGGVKTNVSPVADVANAGGKIEDSGQAIFQAVVKARAASVANPAAPVITQQTLDNVSIAVNRLGHAGVLLNQSLTAYNAAKAGGGNLIAERAAVQQQLNVVGQFLTDIGKALPNGTLQAVDVLVGVILNAVTQVQTGVGL
jgi:hypothetical protein